MFAYEAFSITLPSSCHAGVTVVTYVQAKIASHDHYCTISTFAPVTAPDSGHVNDYKPIQLSKLLESHSVLCAYGRLST